MLDSVRGARTPGRARSPTPTSYAAPRGPAQGQAVFRRTGGTACSRAAHRRRRAPRGPRDVGRHNAVDKVAGARVLAGHSPAESCLVVSGRAGFELVQKAVAAGVGCLVAIGAPTSLAVSLAEEGGLALRLHLPREPSLRLERPTGHRRADGDFFDCSESASRSTR